MKRPIEHFDYSWRGIRIRIAYSPDEDGSLDNFYHYSRLEVASDRKGSPLPITETGYRSHTVPGGTIEAAGGPVAYVVAWLDSAARSSQWKATERDLRQWCLF